MTTNLLNPHVKRILHDINSMGTKSIQHSFCLWWYHNKSINIAGDIENTLLCAQNVTIHKTAYRNNDFLYPLYITQIPIFILW